MRTTQLTIALVLTLLMLSGCAGRRVEEYAPRVKGNLDPELTELDALKNSKGRPLTPREKQILSERTDIPFKLDVRETEEVRRFFQYFTQEKRSTVQAWLNRSEPYLLYVRAVLASQGLPQDIIVLPFIESGYNNMALSSSGAAGMWQFMPFTGRKYGLTVDWWVDERRNPYMASVAAAKYLGELYRNFGDWQLALAAYNAGEGRVSRAMTKSGAQTFNHLAKDQTLLSEETRHYVPKFLAMLKIFQNLKSLGFKTPHQAASQDLEELRAPGGTDLLGLAKASGLEWSEFSAINPCFRRQISPPDRETAVYIPKHRAQKAMAFLSQPQNGPKSGAKTYLTQKDDTWWSVSRRTGIPLAELRRLNQSLPETLGPGRSILVPGEATSQDIMYAEAEPAPKQNAKTGWDHPQKAKGQAPVQAASAQAAYASPSQSPAVSPASYAPATLQTGQVVSYASVLAKESSSAPSLQNTAPPASQPAASGRQTHQVAPGETLYSITKKYGVEQSDVLRANNLSSPAQIKTGQTLIIPGRDQAFNRVR